MYGLTCNNTNLEELSSKPGFLAYTWLSTHPATQNKIKAIINHSNIELNDTTFEDIMNILINDIMEHDYIEERAWNDEAGQLMSIESYIIARTRYAIMTYNDKSAKAYKITVRNGHAGKTDIYVNISSLDANFDKADDKGSTLQDIVADDKSKLIDSVLIDNDLISLVERIIGFAQRSDTNIDVVIYAIMCLDIWCDRQYDDSTLRLLFKALGMTNYVSMKEVMHDAEFIDIYQDVANVTDKETLISLLAKNIFCVKEITSIIKWVVEQVNEASKN